MAKLQQMFGFETTVVRVGRGFFRPLRDAVRRWQAGGPASYRAAGYHFEVLYELCDDRFVLVEYSCCNPERERRGRKSVEIWCGGSASAKVITGNQAVDLLMAWEEEIPASLEALLDAMETDEEEEAEEEQQRQPEIRPLSHWAGKGYAGHDGKVLAHTVQPWEVAREIQRAATRCVQHLRGWRDRQRPSSPGMWDSLMAGLFDRYAVGPEVWWGSKKKVPPDFVGLLDLRWPQEAQGIRTTIEEIQKLLEAPATVPTLILGIGHPDQPTAEEQETARAALVDSLPQFEVLTVRLQDEIEFFAQSCQSPRPAGSHKERGKKPVLPSEDAVRIYWLWASTGASQEEVAELFKKATGKPMVQGQVSRLLAEVKAWRDAGNPMPAIEPPSTDPAQSMDPKKIDMGANPEHRTTRQLRKPSDK